MLRSLVEEPTPLLDPLPAPDDPAPRGFTISVEAAGASVEARVDLYSQRIRCDHPPAGIDGGALARALEAEAHAHDLDRVVVMTAPAVSQGLVASGFEPEARVPGFYRGVGDCDVLGLSLDAARSQLANPREVNRVDAIVQDVEPVSSAVGARTERASADSAPEIAQLISETFDHYPTPSGVPDYIAAAIEGGTPFRIVRDQGEVVACASADLVAEARTAELTDCATRPTHRGRGYMRALLAELMDDLRGIGYPSAFTLARARVPGINIAFRRLGFDFRGRMVQSCRIGNGLEDMNVWSRAL
jgi:putative beta-lysine N-acetyltransferase